MDTNFSHTHTCTSAQLTLSTIFSHCVPLPAAGAPLIMTFSGMALVTLRGRRESLLGATRFCPASTHQTHMCEHGMVLCSWLHSYVHVLGW